MKIELDEVEHQILVKHDRSVMGRALIELQIVDALIQAATAAGYGLQVEDEDEVSGADDLKRLLFNLDDAFVIVLADTGRRAIGWIRLVFGNDGYDLISDYTTNLESFLEPVTKIANFWGGWS